MNRFGTELCLWLLQLYQISLSPLLGPSCRFEPSCSRYAAAALRKFGVAQGSWLAARRIARCHPLGESGFDPVPGQVSDGS